TRPFESGRDQDVVEVKWKAGSVYCPPGGWFHQHFNTGAQPARHLALRYGSRIHPIGFKIADKCSEDGVYIDVKKGGTLIEYADEDRYVREHYEEEIKKTGVKCEMPALETPASVSVAATCARANVPATRAACRRSRPLARSAHLPNHNRRRWIPASTRW